MLVTVTYRCWLPVIEQLKAEWLTGLWNYVRFFTFFSKSKKTWLFTFFWVADHVLSNTADNFNVGQGCLHPCAQPTQPSILPRSVNRGLACIGRGKAAHWPPWFTKRTKTWHALWPIWLWPILSVADVVVSQMNEDMTLYSEETCGVPCFSFSHIFKFSASRYYLYSLFYFIAALRISNNKKKKKKKKKEKEERSAKAANLGRSRWENETRQLSYRKEDRAMRPICGCPEKFWESSLRTRLLFQKFVVDFCSDRY